jgi:diguanylate cyclase (GGDEF)-like protein
VLFSVADTVYVLRIATGTYHGGTMLDPMWAVASVLVACAALRPPRTRASQAAHGWAVLVVPTLFTLLSLGLLVYGSIQHMPKVSVVLAASAVVGAIVRAGITFREAQALAVSRYQARTDELTGLGNRRQFSEAVGAQIAQLAPDERLAVLLLDLDHFKEVNDSLGHTVGDSLLIDVGKRLAEHVRRADVLVRLGGDEFVIMLHDSSTTHSQGTAERLRTALQQVFHIDGIAIHVDVSIGIAICPDVAPTVDGLLQRADLAMYEAKAKQCGYVVYQPSDDDDLTLRLLLVQELRTAIESDELLLHYQPKVDLRSGRLAGVEALVRWNHPVRGLLYPDGFIAVAERYGLMRGLTLSVFRLALDQVRDWRAAGTLTKVAVNVSASNLLDAELPDQIQRMLEARDLPASSLVVEVTESMLMVDAEHALVVLQRLRAIGVRISVDDYGTGYSSLGRLRELPVDELKLDRSFIADMHVDERAAAIVYSTVQLAHSLGLTIVAEGIETANALAQLTTYDCDVGQGYFLSRPLLPEQLTEWLDANDVHPTPRTPEKLLAAG